MMPVGVRCVEKSPHRRIGAAEQGSNHMGLFNKITKGFSSMVGGVDAEVMQIGRPAQAEILGFNAAGTTVQMGGGLVERVCVFNVKIAMDDVAPYTAQVKQRIPEIYIPQLQGLTIVAAKVHPNDPNRIALDFNSPAPNVRMARSNEPANTAAYILQNGESGQAVIVANQPLGRTNPDGLDMYAFHLTVIPSDGRDPYQIQVGNPVPKSALPLLFPGSRVPVKMLVESPNSVVIDWARAQ
jgi:hypothetical protein